jgi:hypothetical protein
MMNKRDPSFNLYQFKYWLSKQPVFELPDSDQIRTRNVMGDLVGTKVESRLGQDRLEKQIVKHNPDLKNIKIIAEAFKKNGGLVAEMHDLKLVVEVTSSKFTLPKMYTKPM